MGTEAESCSSEKHTQVWVLDETCVPVRAMATELKDKRLSARLLLGWATSGVTNTRKKKVFLDTCRRGQEVVTSLEAYRRFCLACGGIEPEEAREEKP